MNWNDKLNVLDAFNYMDVLKKILVDDIKAGYVEENIHTFKDENLLPLNIRVFTRSEECKSEMKVEIIVTSGDKNVYMSHCYFERYLTDDDIDKMLTYYRKVYGFEI